MVGVKALKFQGEFLGCCHHHSSQRIPPVSAIAFGWHAVMRGTCKELLEVKLGSSLDNECQKHVSQIHIQQSKVS